ncbi:glutathione reductase (NADPH) [Nematocida major]|uniref:glutathione reductase (NADPH) n=1 Tax=Nematocida major TaxID=1912982 RepID=UPI002007C221|nr:glutathione reductase (NADPH) [Nematocida major]KAH9385242.1 glutathione reductase (NADPH) [Nematocida major]
MQQKAKTFIEEIMGCSTLIVNGGSFGGRLKYELEKKGAGKVFEIYTEDYTEDRNLLYKACLHAIASAIDRKQHYTDYSMRIEGSARIDWSDIRKRVQERAERMHGERKPKARGLVEEKDGKVYIDGRRCASKSVVIVESQKSSAPTFSNVWIWLAEQEGVPGCVFVQGNNKHAVEAASILSDLGSKVYLATQKKELLCDYEKNIRESVKTLLLEKGVVIFFESSVKSVSTEKKTSIAVEMCTGAEQNISGIDLFLAEAEYAETETTAEGQTVVRVAEPRQKIGMAEVSVLRKICPGIFPEGEQYMPFVPSFVYTSPPAASVGYTQEEAEELFSGVRAANPKFRGLFYAVCSHKVPTDYKLVFASFSEGHLRKEKIVGMHLFGPGSIDAIKGFIGTFHCDISLEEILKTIPIHPTSSEEIITG